MAYSTKKEADHTNTLLSYYSSWFKLKEAVVWYRRFKYYLIKKPHVGPITVNELCEAKRDIILYVQTTLPVNLLS